MISDLLGSNDDDESGEGGSDILSVLLSLISACLPSGTVDGVDLRELLNSVTHYFCRSIFQLAKQSNLYILVFIIISKISFRFTKTFSTTTKTKIRLSPLSLFAVR